MSDASSNGGSHKNPKFSRWQQTTVYVLLVAVVAFTYVLDQRNRAADFRQLCEAGTDTRNVQRAFVEAIYDLATAGIRRPGATDGLTSEEIASYNRFIEQSNQFRNQMYNRIKPSEVCAPYVTDDDVDPPSPSLPLLPTLPTTEGVN